MPPLRFARGRLPLIGVVLLVAILATGSISWAFDRFGAGPGPSPARPRSVATAVATPTMDLAQAETLVRQGELEAGIVGLRGLIGAGDAASDAEARLELAKALQDTGQNVAAIETLRELRKAYPTSPQASLAAFFLARGWDTLGDERQAIESYRAFLATNPPSAAYVRLLLADALRRSGDTEGAEREAEAVARAPVIRRTAVDALERLQALQQRDDLAAYLGTTNQLLGLATVLNYRLELLYERAETEQQLNKLDAAVDDYRLVANGDPQSGYAAQAIAALDALGHSDAIGPAQRALVVYYSGDEARAIDLFTAALAQNSDDDQSWYYRALTRDRQGDATGIAELRGLVTRFPESRYLAPALLKIGVSAEAGGDRDAARSAYQSLLSRRPASDEAAEARFRLGLLAYQAGDLSSAAAIWSGGSTDQQRPARLSFWLGKARAALGDHDGAVAAWSTAEQVDPRGYYGTRAGELGSGRSDVQERPSSGDLALAGSPETDLEALETWYRSFGTERQISLAEVTAEPAYATIHELLQLGLTTQAGWEIEALADRYQAQPAALAALATLLIEQQGTAQALPVAQQLAGLADRLGFALVPAVERLLYPVVYPELVQRESVAREIDPRLLLGLIRQESAFDPHATSWVGARGLAQVMPETGQGIASALGIKPWAADDLYRPSVAIEFGALYLADRLRGYEGSVYPALAGYNAGDGNVAGWLNSYGLTDPDLFAERIPFPETHDYVQRVYANYLNYQRLYR